MRAGELDRRIELQRRTVGTTDTNGSAPQTFATYATVSAQKIDAGGREYFAGNQEQANLDTRFKIRHRSDVTVTDRISFDGLSFDITHIQELGRREGLMLYAAATRT